MTVADLLREEGRSEGLQEGQRRALLKLLGTRFGSLSEAAVAKIQASGPAQIEVWLERVLTAPTLADVLGEA